MSSGLGVRFVVFALLAGWPLASYATKADLDVHLELVANDDALIAAGQGELTLLILPDVDVEQARVEFEVERGDARILGGPEWNLGTLAAGGAYTVDAPVELLGSGKVGVRAWLIGVDAQARRLFRQSKALYFGVSGGEVASDPVGYLPAQLKALERRNGALAKSRYETELGLALRGGATTEITASRQKGLGTTISGIIRWTDQDGGLQPAGFVEVEVHDVNDGSDAPLTSTQAVSTGFYTIIGDFAGRDIFVRVKSTGNLAKVRIALDGEPHAIDSAVIMDAQPETSYMVDITANNMDDNNVAFSVFAGFNAIALYAANRAFLTDRENLQIVFPAGGTSYNDAMKRIQLLRDDWPDYDVMGHEYGHFYERQLMFNESPGGSHTLFSNNAETGGHTKDEGVRLAWSEGHATYFGIVAQILDNVTGIRPPGYRDTVYIDYLDGGGANHDMEQNTSRGRGTGEDNELSVMRILWDLYDRVLDEHDETVFSPGFDNGSDRALDEFIRTNTPVTLDEFWDQLTANPPTVDMREVELGCVFMDHRVAPEPMAPADGAMFGAADAPPEFRWEPRGGGPANRSNKFTVEFWNHNFTEMILASPEVNDPMWTPTMAQWDTILNGGDIVKWVVKGSNTNAAETGAYTSCDRVIGGVDVAFVIDDTGSMSEEIGGVRSALTAFITALAGEEDPPTISLITFKDGVSSLIVSNDLAAVQTQVDALVALGGDDCPEASVQALTLAGRHVRNAGRILFATDADAHSGLDIGARIAALRGRGTRVDVLLTGACTSVKYVGSCNDGLCGDGAEKTIGECDLPECLDAPPDPPVFTTDALQVYSAYAAETGGLFAFIPEVNAFDTTRFNNVALNVMLGTVFPSITDVSPPVVNQAVTADIVVSASNTNFNSSSRLEIAGGGISVNSVEVLSPTSIRANITVASDAAVDFRDVLVTTTLGDGSTIEEAMGVGAIEVEPVDVSPRIISVFPAQTTLGETLDITVFGANTNFDETSILVIGGADRVTVNSIQALSATEILANVTISENDAILGFQDIRVTTGGEFANEFLPGPLLVTSTALTSGLPRIDSISPPSGAPGTTAILTVIGVNTNFEDGVTQAAFSGGGITVNDLMVVSATELTMEIAIDAAGPFGFRDLSVTTGAEVAAALNAFEVGNAAPIADAGEDQLVTIAAGTAQVTLDGSGSSDTDGSIAAYRWTGVPDPDDVASPMLDLGPGEYTFTLIVEDDQGAMSEPDEVTIVVNGAPVADAGPDRQIEVAQGDTATVTLDGSASADAAKIVMDFIWTGTPDPEDIASPTVTLGEGTHTFTLVVTDDRGAMSAPDQVTITVTETGGGGMQCASDGSRRPAGSAAADLSVLAGVALMLGVSRRRRA